MRYQRVLAGFLDVIATEGGWWYRIPKLTPDTNDATKKKKKKIPDEGPVPDMVMLCYFLMR